MTVQKKDGDKTIENGYEDLIAIAEKEYPNLIKEVETFTSDRISQDGFQEYLDAISLPPNIVTSNHTS